MLRTELPVSLLVLCLSLVAAGQNSSTATDQNAEQAAVVEKIATLVHYEDSGTGFQEETAVIHVQSTAGVQQYGQLIFGYNSGTENLELNYVRVRKASGEVVETPASSAQDFAPETLQTAPMYGDYRERHVTVVGLRPGDTLEYKITRHITSALAPGQFWYEYNFPKHEAVTQAVLTVEIPQGRQLILKTPKQQYVTEDKNGWRTYRWTKENIAPPKSASDEDEDEDEPYAPDVQFSSFTDWKQVSEWYAKLQGSQVVVDDTIRAKALELTRGAMTPTEKAQRLYDYVAKEIRYVSLSFGVGRYQPHTGPEVLRASYGDCKDKHTLLAALLRAVDIQSYPVLIGAGRQLDPEVPSPAQFNHVITLAHLGNQLVWLDTTPEVAPFAMLIYPLRGEQALVAAEDANGGLRRTPVNSPVKSSLAFTITGKISEVGSLNGTVEVTTTGDNAFPLRSAFRGLAAADWKRLAEKAFSNGGSTEITDLKVEGLEDTSKPLLIQYHVRQEKAFNVPSSDATFSPFPLMAFRMSRTKPSAQPLRIGPQNEITYHAHLEFPANFTFTLPAEMTMTRDYADYSTKYRLSGNVLEATQKLVIKTDELPPSRLSDVLSMRGVVLNIRQQSLAYVSGAASREARLASAAPVGTDTASLHKAGTKALQQREYQAAVDSLMRVVEQDAKNKDAWDELGKAYSGLDDHDDAIMAFRKQVEIDPYHKTAYDDLAAELQEAGKTDEAMAAYRKQLANDALDRFAHKGLGLMLLDTNRDQEALVELQAAAAIPPSDAEIDLALGQLYMRLGQTGKAKPLLMRIVGSAAPFPKGDIYAAALGNDINPDQTLRDARDILGDISDQFESGTYTELTPDTPSVMQFVALEWARVGWARFLKGDSLEGLRYLTAAWDLSQSGTVANRLARVYEKAGQTADAKRMFALAAVAGGAEARDSRAQLQRLDPSGSEHDLAQATTQLAQLLSVKVATAGKTSGSAEFTFVFDGSSKPDRVVYRAGASELRNAEHDLVSADYPVQFPDQSSLKIVRSGKMSCTALGCSISLKPVAFKTMADASH